MIFLFLPSLSGTWIIKCLFHYQRATCTFTEDNQVRFKAFLDASFFLRLGPVSSKEKFNTSKKGEPVGRVKGNCQGYTEEYGC